jgi:hypothetical protein
MSLLELQSIRDSSYKIVPGPLFSSSLFDRHSFMTASLTPSRNGTADQPSWASGQILPEPTIALDPFLRLSAAPCGWMPVPISILQCSDSFHCGPFFRDFLIFRHCLIFLLDLTSNPWHSLFLIVSHRGLHFL